MSVRPKNKSVVSGNIAKNRVGRSDFLSLIIVLNYPALVVLWRRGASSGWRMEEALREITPKGCAE